MKLIKDFFVENKYQKIRNGIFHFFVYSIIITGLFFFFTGINLPGIIIVILFVCFAIPNTLFNSFDVIYNFFKKRK